MRRHRLSPLAAALALLAAAAAGQLPSLLALPGPPVTVRYAPGALARAAEVQERLGLLVAEAGWRKTSEPLLDAELLPDEDWRAAGLAEPFGLPAITGGGALALPAWGTAETVELWRRLLGRGLPSASGAPLRGSSEEAASLVAADLVGDVEASRLLLARLGLVGGAPWIDDLLACALATSANQRQDPGRWPQASRLLATLAASPEAARDERLRRLRWVAASERIGAESGKLPARPLLKLARKGRGPLTAEALVARFPWLAEWRAPQAGL